MSELKGQLLGIILVISLFAAISACVVGVFGQYTTAITSSGGEIAEMAKVSEEVTPEE